MSKAKIAHLILAAGASSRMKQPKQILPWGTTTLIGHAIEQSIALKNVHTMVVLGAHSNEIQDKIEQFSITILNHTNWRLGMGSSISFGIDYMMSTDVLYDGVLISLVDQPLIETSHFNTLIATFQEKSKNIIASDLGSRVGVPAVFSKNFFSDLSKLNKDYGARYLIQKHQDQTETIAANDIAIDIDTIEQYEALYKRKFLN